MKSIYSIFSALLVVTAGAIGQTTETFETESSGATSFTDNGQVFNIITYNAGIQDFDIQTAYPGTGWNGSSADNRYLDNDQGTTSNPSFGIETNDGTDFTFKSAYMFLANNSANNNVSGTLQIVGKKDGVTQFDVNASAGFETGGTNNGFSFINMSTFGGSNNSNTVVDELVFTMGGSFAYIALDAFTWDVVSVPTWNGSSSTDWNTAANWSSNAVPTSTDNVIIPSAPSNQPHVTSSPGSPAACANLTVESGATLTIDAGKALTVSGATDNDGTILIEADATGIGSFIDNGTITGSGSFQMEQYLTGSGGATPDGVFYYVSSPIPNATAATYGVPASNKLWVDDEATQAYPELTFGAIPLEVGQGYIARMGATGTTTFSGSSFNTGNITEGGLTRTGTTELNRGYNLVGNPYPSTVDWDDLTRTNLETTMWYRTHQGSTMLYDTYNATGMIGTNNNGNGAVDGTIPPTQAFWVRVDADGNTGQLDFENADRSHGTLAGIYKTEAEEGTVRMVLSNGSVSDEAIIYFNAGASDGYDYFDSRKYWAAASLPQVYTNVTEDTLAINGLYSTTTNPTVPLGLKVPAQGSYTLDANDITVVGETVHLEDTYLNIFQDLNLEPNYAFVSDAGNIGDRFILHFGMTTVGVQEVKPGSRVFAANGQLHVILPDNVETGTVEILDMSGRTVSTYGLKMNRNSIDVTFSSGSYLIRVETSVGADTHKVVIP